MILDNFNRFCYIFASPIGIFGLADGYFARPDLHKGKGR